eukprot:scaffold3806_cov41-Cyclotella_meneghiniana.AAC.1
MHFTQHNNQSITQHGSEGGALFKWRGVNWSRTQQFAFGSDFLFQCYKSKLVDCLPSSERRNEFETTRMQQPLLSGVPRGFGTSMVPVEAVLRTRFVNVTSWTLHVLNYKIDPSFKSIRRVFTEKSGVEEPPSEEEEEEEEEEGVGNQLLLLGQ